MEVEEDFFNYIEFLSNPLIERIQEDLKKNTTEQLKCIINDNDLLVHKMDQIKMDISRLKSEYEYHRERAIKAKQSIEYSIRDLKDIQDLIDRFNKCKELVNVK